jgi:hypothetical protein
MVGAYKVDRLNVQADQPGFEKVYDSPLNLDCNFVVAVGAHDLERE